MKHKLKGVLGIGLTMVMVLSLTVAFVPVATAADYEENDWGEWGLPSLEVDTDVGPMAVAPDGTLFAAVYDDSEPEWKVMKSEDDGYTWDDTELTGLTPAEIIVSVVVSPNYEEDETLYVGTYMDTDPTVFRLEEAGEGDVIALKEIVDSEGSEANYLFNLDVWTDEDDYNWILVATELDVLVLKDKTFEDWRDQELASGSDKWVAYEVAFAPDFDASDLIWAVVDDAINGLYPGTGNDFRVTATASPGQWGQDIGKVDLGLLASPFLDIDFPDDYDSDPDSGNTNLWVALSSPDVGDIFLIEGVDEDDGDSNAISMFVDIGDEDPTDFTSIAVSGDYGDEIILAGELNSPTVWISDDGGYGWADVDKSPTGSGWTHVYMGADVVWDGEVFDTDDGMAFASTVGVESAVSRSNDGGQVFNQTGLIDTEIELILDLGLHPDFPDTATYLMSTHSTTTSIDGTTSLWLTENGDEEEPDYMRVLCGDPTETVGNFAGWFGLVDYSQDGDAIYITGVEWVDVPLPDAGAGILELDELYSVIWKSTDDGQTFGKKRSVDDGAYIRDWEITEDDTIYAATWDFDDTLVTLDVDGFSMTTNSGLSWTSVDVGSNMNDIALSPDFEDDETILLGGMAGNVYMSDDAGDAFDDTDDSATTDLFSGDEVFVAFDADYADEDADGYTLIYAADDNGSVLQVGEVADTDDVDWDVLEDDTDDGTAAISCEGLVVSEDNVLYAAFDGDGTFDRGDATDVTVTNLARLILHEDDSLWESQDDAELDDAFHLWVTPGSNVLWTIDMDIGGDAQLWVLEDTCSGQVTLDSPADGYQHDREDVIQLAWDEIRGADEYELEGTESSGLGTDIEEDEIDDTDINVDVDGSSEYDWKVRVSPGEPWSSRWSDEWMFNTALGAPPWAPELFAPGNGDTDVPLMPAFAWETAKTADSYQFQLNDSPDFATLVDVKVSTEAYQIDFDLEYDTTYYWRVKAFRGSKAISRFSEVSVFTTMAKPGAPPPPPPPPATVTQPAPAPIIMPTPIPPVLLWVIVGIGAALIIAVIILIVRTRRAV